jgi:DNA helicase-2/ATP-dependent DNA helicase PcrA
MRKIRLHKAGNDRLRERFERELNEAQRAAATASDGFNLILAGPGSGKTRVITYRVAYLITKGVPAESILLVTFTRRAAREMIGRLETLIGPRATRVWAGTFHHIGNRLLRQSAGLLGYGPNFTILDSEDQRDILELAMHEVGLVGSGSYAPKPPVVQRLLSLAFNQRRPLAEILADRAPTLAPWLDRIEGAAAAYERRKREANSVDYDDLLGLWVRLIDEFPDQRTAQGRMFRHILVDEMQDTNALQVALVEAIARAGEGNLTAVGDDAQSIYRFRGAEYANILEFNRRNPEARVFKLETNYRSTPQIVAFTNASIAHNRTGFSKTLSSTRPPGPRPLVVPAADVFEEAEFLCQQILDNVDQGVPLGQMAVLYRNHYDSVIMQSELASRSIPYSIRGGLRFFEQAHIKDVLAYLRVLVNPRDELAWRRLAQLLPGIGPAKAAVLWEHLASTPDPLVALATPETMRKVPAKAKGHFAAFVADLRKLQATDPFHHPSEAVIAILQGGYPEVVRNKYERPDDRLRDIEQLGVLAARYENLEKLVADLLLAGDVHGMDHLDEEEPGDVLVLSTIHQAKGLEWSRVFLPRLIEDSFPSTKALAEPEGEEEERRIFYVAVTRAMDELVLTYPLTIARGGRGPTILATPSRFLTEIDPTLWESAVLETDLELAWSDGPRSENTSRSGEARPRPR